MKIIRDQDELGRLRLMYQVGDYDAQPSAPALVVDRVLNQEVAPRLALAQALMYLSSTSGPVTTQDALAPPTAEVLGTLSCFHGCVATNVQWKYADIPQGTVRVAVDECRPGAMMAVEPGTSVPTTHLAVHLLPTSSFGGSLSALREAWITTNAGLVGSTPAPEVDRMHRQLAVLLLVSADLDAAGFVIPEVWVCDKEEWSSYRMLFKTVGLDLDCAESAGDVDHV